MGGNAEETLLMTSKEQKTATELAAMIMAEVHLYPEFNAIVDVTISPTQQGLANWTASFTIEASRSGPWPVFPEADKLIRLFQDDFDLA
jgi:hypothetical protein